MTTYEITYAEPYMIETLRRLRRCHKLSRFVLLLKMFLGLMLALVIAACAAAKIYFGMVVCSAFLILLFVGRRIDERIACRRLRNSPYWGDHAQIRLSPEGFAFNSKPANAQLTWTAFTAAHRFSDGLLLTQGPGLYNWLPHSAIIEGTAEDAELLIRSNIAKYKAIA